MNLSKFAVGNRVVVSTALLLCLVSGTLAYYDMSRREDPRIVIRTSVVVTRWPGARAEKVENLVTDPIEEAAGEIDQVKEIVSESRTGLSIVYVTLEDDVIAVDQVWDDLRAKVDRVRSTLPRGSSPPMVDTDFDDVFAVCLALHQVPGPGTDRARSPYSPRELEVWGQKVVDELKEIESVAKVRLEGVQREVVHLEVDSGDWGRIDLSTADLARILEARNIVAPGGEIDTERGRFSVQPSGEFEAVPELSTVLVGQGEGQTPVRLGDLGVSIERRYEEPARALCRYGSPAFGQTPCLVLAVSMKDGRNIVEMGEEIDRRIANLEASVLPSDLRLARVNDIPRQVEAKVGEFVSNLWEGMAIVFAVALLMLGFRPALIMAGAPLSIVASILVVSKMGVDLESCSIASLIIALGMLVDNVIVVSDNALRLVAEGRSRAEASWRGAHELAIPILSSTLTNAAAFVPMLWIPGSLGEYIRSLPIVVSVTLLASYLIAMTVSPLLLSVLLPARTAGVASWRPLGPLARRYRRLVAWCVDHWTVTLGTAAAALAGSLALLPSIGTQFFPPGYRDQFYVHVWLPEGSPIAATDAVTREVEAAILRTSRKDGAERLAGTVSFVGYGGPRLFLSANPEQEIPNYAHVVVNTSGPDVTAAWVEELRAEVSKIPGARIEVRPYDLGPGVKNPVEFRLSGEDGAVLRREAAQWVRLFRDTPGSMNAYHNWHNAGYQIQVDVDEEAASRAGVTNADVADTLDGLLSGAHLTTFREGDHEVAVVFRARRQERARLGFSGVFVPGRSGKVPLSSLTRLEPTYEPAVIVRRDQERTITVGCQVASGHLANDVSAALLPALEERVRRLGPGYSLARGGEMKETETARRDVNRAFIVGLALIVLVLIIQYDSWLKPLVILLTIPLGLIGALLGLYVTGWPLGFMASLGIVSLAGVVVNNALILIDFIDGGLASGTPLRAAVIDAGLLRMRPILLTTLTTMGGLVPLAYGGGPLWEPMAWVMLFGLVVATFLTLLVIPTMYCLFAEKLGMRVPSPGRGAEPGMHPEGVAAETP